MLYEAVNLAVSKHMLKFNPTTEAEKPTCKNHKAKSLTRVEQLKLQDTIGSSDYRYKPIYELALATGLRLGELIALRWDDVDLTRGTLEVTQTYRRVKVNFDINSNLPKTIIKKQGPKTDNGFREVPIPKPAVNKLIIYIYIYINI